MHRASEPSYPAVSPLADKWPGSREGSEHAASYYQRGCRRRYLPGSAPLVALEGAEEPHSPPPSPQHEKAFPLVLLPTTCFLWIRANRGAPGVSACAPLGPYMGRQGSRRRCMPFVSFPYWAVDMSAGFHKALNGFPKEFQLSFPCKPFRIRDCRIWSEK